MISHGIVYELSRRLQLLNYAEHHSLPKGVKGELMRKHPRDSLHKAYLKGEKNYNLRCRRIKFTPGQEIYRRNSRHSEFKSSYNAKLASKVLKCRVIKPIGNSLYEIEDLQGKRLSVFHAKDLKQ